MDNEGSVVPAGPDAEGDPERPVLTPEPLEGAEPAGGVLTLLDTTLSLQNPLVARHLARIRRRHPDASPAQVTKRLNAELRAATITAGAGVGAAAAAPGVGTVAGLALSGAESVGFLNAASLYVLSRAEVHGIPLVDVERRRTLVMAVLLGEAGAKSIQQVAGRTGAHWARQIVRAVPRAKIKAVNRVLGRHFVTRYGTRQGVLVLGRVVPFGVGAVIGGTANAVFSQGIIKAADRAFGPVPPTWGDRSHP